MVSPLQNAESRSFSDRLFAFLFNVQQPGELLALRDELHVLKRNAFRHDDHDNVDNDGGGDGKSHGEEDGQTALRHGDVQQLRGDAVDRPSRRAHDGGAHERAEEGAAVARLHTQAAINERAVHHADDGVARDGADRRAEDVDFRAAHEQEVADDLDDAAGDHGQNGQLFVSARLQNGVRDERDADEDGGDGHVDQNGRTHRVRARIEHADNRIGEDGEPDAHRQRDDRGDAQPALRRRADLLVRAARGGGRDCRNDGDGHRRNKARREVIECLHGAVGPVKLVGKRGADAGNVRKLDVDELRVDEGDDAHDGGAERDDETDHDKLPQRMSDGIGLVAAEAAGLQARSAVLAQIAPEHVDERGERAGGDAEDRAGGAHRQALARTGEHHGEDKSDDDLDEHLEHLSDRGRGHVAVALNIAAERAREAHEQHRGRERPNALADLRLADEKHRHLRREQEHGEREHNAQHGEDDGRDAEGPPCLPRAVQRVRLADHAAERHGKSRGGDREQHVIDRVGGEEIAVARVAQNVLQRDLVDRAEDLHNDHTGGKDRRAVEKVLLFCLCQACYLQTRKRALSVLYYMPIRGRFYTMFRKKSRKTAGRRSRPAVGAAVFQILSGFAALPRTSWRAMTPPTKTTPMRSVAQPG